MGKGRTLIEVTTRLYLGSVSTLLLQRGDFWFADVSPLAALGLITSLLVWRFDLGEAPRGL